MIVKPVISVVNSFMLICYLPCLTVVYANEEQSRSEPDWWLEQEELTATDSVSEGKLRFLLEPPAKPVLHSLNRLTVLASSLDDGWINLYQCYQNLDPVADAEVVYRYKAMRELKIINYRNIDKAEIEGQAIQLKNVRKQAELCVTAMVRIFYRNADSSFSLINGPFHRKFLDGYYPYYLTLEVIYPSSKLKFKQIIPVEQPGFAVEKQTGKLHVEAVFDGILNIEIVFLPYLSFEDDK
jgi:hypothetical protein